MKLIPWRNKGNTRISRLHEDRPLARAGDEMTDFLRRLWDDPWGTNLSELLGSTADFGPRMDMTETENALSMQFDVPGVKPEDVNIHVAGNVLTVSGVKKAEKESRKGETTYSERSFGSFTRSVTLPSTVDPNKVDATYKDGVLTVTLPKHADAKPKRVTVRKA